MVKIYCDRCDKEVTTQTALTKIKFCSLDSTGHVKLELIMPDKDICQSCMDYIKNCLRDHVKAGNANAS